VITGRLFVVEDEALIAMELVDRLTNLGYEVVGDAASGEVAIGEIAARSPDLVLMDIRLAGPMSGIDAAVALRERGLAVPVVFLTAYSDPDLLERAKTVEPAGYLVKPFEERELHATVQMALYKGRAEVERRERMEERRLAELRLAHGLKTESLGRMAGAIAHVVNNGLTGVMLHLELGQALVAPSGQLHEHLSAALDGVRALADRSRALRAYVDAIHAIGKVADAAGVCREAVPLFDLVLPERARLTISIPEAPWMVHANEGLLEAAIVSLVANAGEALEGATGDVDLRFERVARQVVASWRTFPEEWIPSAPEYVAITVRDSGVGIPLENVPKLFDPFYSTKQLGRGLGLASALSAVRAGGGAVAVSSEQARGAELRLVLLPVEPRP